jgi:hypothetical protein
MQRVVAANNMLYGAVRLIRKANGLGIGGYLENPRTSRIFLTPQILKLVKQGIAVFVDLDMCQYGTQWKKPTRLLVWGPNKGAVVLSKCQPRGCICFNSNRPHLMLTGVSKGKFRTAVAQVYPMQFAKTLMHQLSPPYGSGDPSKRQRASWVT